MTDSSREAFEAHMRKLNACTRLARQSAEAGGHYRTLSVQSAWNLWQASRLAALEEAEAACEAVGDEYDMCEGGRYPELKSDAVQGARSCEAAIRSLSTTPKGEQR